MERKYILLICFLIIALCYWVISQTNWGQTKETVRDSAEDVKSTVKEEHENTRNFVAEELKKFTTEGKPLSEKSRKLLHQLFGPNYENELENKETFQNLIKKLEGKSLEELLFENKNLENQIIKLWVDKIGDFLLADVLNLLKTYRYSEARTLIDKFITKNSPDNQNILARLYSLKAFCYSSEFNSKNALKLYKRAIDLDKESIPINFRYAKELDKSGQPKKATKYFDIADSIIEGQEEASSHKSGSYLLIDLYYSWSRSLISLNQYDLAFEKTEKALSLNLDIYDEKYNFEEIYLARGIIQRMLGNSDEALKYLKLSNDIAQKKFPGDNHFLSSNYVQMASVYSQIGVIDKALELNQKALDYFLKTFGENHPELAHVYEQMAFIYKVKNDDEKSIPYYKKSINLSIVRYGENDPELLYKYRGISESLAMIGRYDEAWKYTNLSVEKTKEIFGENSLQMLESKYSKGYVLYLSKKSLEAEKILLSTLKEFKANYPKGSLMLGKNYFMLGRVYFQMSDCKNAIKYYEECILEAKKYYPIDGSLFKQTLSEFERVKNACSQK